MIKNAKLCLMNNMRVKKNQKSNREKNFIQKSIQKTIYLKSIPSKVLIEPNPKLTLT